MREKTQSFFEYINWLFKKYQEVQAELQGREAYRIVNVIENSHSPCLIKVHVVGTGKEVDYTPQEIMEDDHLLECFSKQDVRAIAFHACNDLKKPEYKISESRFSEKIKKILFRVKKYASDETIEQSADKLSQDQSIIARLSPQDAHCIGYAYGTENIIMENEEKRKLWEMHEENKNGPAS